MPPVLRFEFRGGMKMPIFDLADAWLQSPSEAPAPWAELRGRSTVLSVPAAAVLSMSTDEIGRLVRHWDAVTEAQRELAGDAGAPAVRLVLDIQKSVGLHHYLAQLCLVNASGSIDLHHNPERWTEVVYRRGAETAVAGAENSFKTARCQLVSALLDGESLIARGDWGIYHELGHARQQAEWTFEGTMEVTVNLFTLYAMQELHAEKDPLSFVCRYHPTLKTDARSHLADGAPFEKWKSNPFLALVPYLQVQAAFGWTPFRTVFHKNLSIDVTMRPQEDIARRETFILNLSLAAGRNLAPFWIRWGIVPGGAGGEVATRLERALRHLDSWNVEGQDFLDNSAL
eukprot:gnl/TRDRNA2_/TRDRNA2_124867_c1_seq2.p1 gnl/TRDRNA2_/TRDRNA2_124867_c1~~gnl/TRDRNA2_/TRDRNA2_124867_c1_seq2.p1  ORF type:complete len:353 (-),score=54.89 gnl/TRDRNA2_/TRDRNA2_124867_c1_seq2:17-1045(-)